MRYPAKFIFMMFILLVSILLAACEGENSEAPTRRPRPTDVFPVASFTPHADAEPTEASSRQLPARTPRTQTAAIPTVTPVDHLGSLPLNFTLDDEVSDETGDFWVFDGRTGQRVTIDLISTNGLLDAYLVLFAPNGDTVAENDDGGAQLNARLENIRLPQDGSYLIQARGYAGDTGNYRLQIVGR